MSEMTAGFAVNAEIPSDDDSKEEFTEDDANMECSNIAANRSLMVDVVDMAETGDTSDINETASIPVRRLVLPQAIVTRIIKEAIPRSTRVRVEVRDGISTAAIKFIHHLTALGVKNAQSCKRKTVGVQDVFNGLIQAGFQDFIRPLQDLLIERNQAKQLKLTSRVQHVYPSEGSNSMQDGDYLEANETATIQDGEVMTSEENGGGSDALIIDMSIDKNCV